MKRSLKTLIAILIISVLSTLAFTACGGSTIEITGISVTTQPTKVVYEEGETFDATGMVVMATYSDLASVAITDYTVDTTMPLTVDDKSVTITYGDFTTSVDITVNEKVVEPTITYYSVKVDGVALEDEYAEGDEVTLTVPTASAGYEFDGWSSDEVTVTDNKFTMIDGDVEVTATYKAISYDITYVGFGESNTNPTTYTIESDTITFVAPTASEGYSVSLDKASITKGSTGAVTVTATTTAINYDITYVLGDGTNNASNPTTYTIESATITLADPTAPSGYTFAGWTEGSTIATGSTGAKTFTATYDLIITSVTAPTANNTTFTYNGSAQTYALTENDAYTITNATQTNAGTYTVTVSLKDKTTTKWSDDTTTDKTFTFTIAKASVAVVWSDATYTYNGTAQAPTATVTGVGTDSLTATVTGAGTNAGDYTATASISNDNYTLTNTTKGFTIAKATATINVDAITASYTYTASEQSVTSGATTNSDGTISYTNNSFTNAGEHTITVSVEATTNYTSASTTKKITVAQAEVTVVMTSYTVTAGDAVPSYLYTVTGMLGSDDLSATVVCDYTTLSIVGTYDITITYTNTNYNATITKGTVTVQDPAVTYYTITFNDGGETTTQSVEENTVITQADATADTGNTFQGWFTQENGEGTQFVSGTTTATAQITYYAYYTINSYKVTFSYEVDGSLQSDESTLNYGATITAPANPTKDADGTYTYVFKEWNTESDGSGTAFVVGSTVAGEVTYYAIFTATLIPVEYTITVDSAITNGTVVVSYEESALFGGETITVTITASSGYYLVSYEIVDDNDSTTITDNGDGTYTFTMPDGNITFTATFAEQTQLVAPTGSLPTNTYQAFNYYSANANFLEFMRYTNDVDGWSTSDGLFADENVDYVKYYVYTSSTADKDDYVAEFMFVRGLINASVGTIASMDLKSTCKFESGYNNTTVGLGTFAVFMSEIIDSYTTTTEYYFAIQLCSDYDTYAPTEISDIGTVAFREYYEITYVTNGGTINSGEVASAKVGTAATLPTDVTNGDSIFEGWYENADFTGSNVLATTVARTTNVTYYAKWTNEITALPTLANTIEAFNVNSINSNVFLEFLRYKNDDGAGINLFTTYTALDYVKYYIYTSADASSDSYVGTFNMLSSSNGMLSSGDQTLNVAGGLSDLYLANQTTEFASLIEYSVNAQTADSYVSTQTYYFAIQLVAISGTAYSDGGISPIGTCGFTAS